MLSSRLDGPEIDLVSERDTCPTRNLDQAFGLLGVDDAVTNAIVATMPEIIAGRSAEIAEHEVWDQDDVRQCVARIAGSREPEGPLMADLVMSGLRDAQVHGTDDTGLYLSADEHCALVERVARSALSDNSAGDRQLTLCPNASHRACGDPAVFSVNAQMDVPPD